MYKRKTHSKIKPHIKKRYQYRKMLHKSNPICKIIGNRVYIKYWHNCMMAEICTVNMYSGNLTYICSRTWKYWREKIQYLAAILYASDNRAKRPPTLPPPRGGGGGGGAGIRKGCWGKLLPVSCQKWREMGKQVVCRKLVTTTPCILPLRGGGGVV